MPRQEWGPPLVVRLALARTPPAALLAMLIRTRSVRGRRSCYTPDSTGSR